MVKEKEKVGLDLEFAEIFGELNTLIKKDTPYINSNNNAAFNFCHKGKFFLFLMCLYYWAVNKDIKKWRIFFIGQK